jgi:hypothetical protein
MSPDRAALKSLRERRGADLEATQAQLKEQIRVNRDLTRLLEAGPKTVPALAEALGMPTDKVFWHLIAMKKYGQIAEGEQDGDYFQYRIIKPQEK